MIDDVVEDTRRRMQTSLEVLARELRSLRTGKANIAILDDITVSYYDTQTPLNQLASLSAPEPNLLVVQPYDKTAIENIEKAILQTDLGLNPSNDGNVVRVPIPELTEERRVELSKIVGRMAEEGKTAVRQIRRDANDGIKALEAKKQVSQDDEHRGYKKVQELTDHYCQSMEELAQAKSEELLAV